jgi:ribosomal protein L16 Arg81 hydroxylase
VESGSSDRCSGPFDLARLIAPVDVETFTTSYWERQPLVVQARMPSYYDELLSPADTDHVLMHSSIRSQDVRIVRAGQEAPLDKLWSPGANLSEGGLEALYQEYRDGSTIILTFLHERWPPLRRLCQSLAAETSAAVQVNVYITPPGAQGLDTHYDSHDVFVLQTAGSKRWRVFGSPTRLPLPEHGFRPEAVQDPGPPLHDLLAHPGDLLYIPRGYVHDAASAESFSVHLTVGLRSITWASVIRGAVEAVFEQEAPLRESLPLGFAANDDTRRDSEERLRNLLGTTVAEVSVEKAIADAYEHARAHRQPSLEGHLGDLGAEADLDLDTRLQRRPGTAWTLRSGADGVSLVFHGKRMRLPLHTEPAVRFVAETTGTFMGSDLPGELGAKGTLVLLRRLLREGFVTTRHDALGGLAGPAS